MENTEKVFWASLSAMIILIEIFAYTIFRNNAGLWNPVCTGLIVFNGTFIYMMYQRLKRVRAVSAEVVD